MESPSKDRAILDNAQAGLGCDTVASFFGVGKGTVIKHLKDGYPLSAIGNADSQFKDVIH